MCKAWSALSTSNALTYADDNKENGNGNYPVVSTPDHVASVNLEHRRMVNH